MLCHLVYLAMSGFRHSTHTQPTTATPRIIDVRTNVAVVIASCCTTEAASEGGGGGGDGDGDTADVPFSVMLFFPLFTRAHTPKKSGLLWQIHESVRFSLAPHACFFDGAACAFPTSFHFL